MFRKLTDQRSIYRRRLYFVHRYLLDNIFSNTTEGAVSRRVCLLKNITLIDIDV